MHVIVAPRFEAEKIANYSRGHLVDDVNEQLSEGKTHLVIIPGELTSILQLLDLSVNIS